MLSTRRILAGLLCLAALWALLIPGAAASPADTEDITGSTGITGNGFHSLAFLTDGNIDTYRSSSGSASNCFMAASFWARAIPSPRGSSSFSTDITSPVSMPENRRSMPATPAAVPGKSPAAPPDTPPAGCPLPERDGWGSPP